MADNGFYHALTINPEVCMGCTHCIGKCPTGALRIRDGKAVIHENWCVDCAECMKVCPVGAIYVRQNDFEKIFDHKIRVALIPAVFLGQFPDATSEKEIYDALYALGFTHICPVEATVETIREAMAESIAAADEKPSISPFCPAIVRLIQVRFPDLVDNIINVKTPVEATALMYRQKLRDEGYSDGDIGIFYITPCAAKIASLKESSEYSELISGVLNLDFMYNKVCHLLQNTPEGGLSDPDRETPAMTRREMNWSQTSGEADCFEGRCFAVDEIHNVIEFIEKLELTGELHGIDFLELRACDRGCGGGVLTPADRFLVAESMHKRSMSHPKGSSLEHNAGKACATYIKDNIRTGKLRPKPKLLYQGDINEVLEKMAAADKIRAMLPGIDCGACGSPGCKTLAEDVVRGDAKISNCVFMQRRMEKSGALSGDQARTILEEVWGENRASENNHKK